MSEPFYNKKKLIGEQFGLENNSSNSGRIGSTQKIHKRSLEKANCQIIFQLILKILFFIKTSYSVNTVMYKKNSLLIITLIIKLIIFRS